MNMSSRSLKTEVTWSQDNTITGQLKHWLPSKMPALNYSVTHRIRHSCTYCTQTAGWNCFEVTADYCLNLGHFTFFMGGLSSSKLQFYLEYGRFP